VAYACEQVVGEQRMKPEEEDEKMVVDEKPASAAEAYNLDNKTLHDDLAQNEIVVVVVEELILDLKVFRQYSKY
jgi:hypothetical protein